jgi:hypothetical protein
MPEWATKSRRRRALASKSGKKLIRAEDNSLNDLINQPAPLIKRPGFFISAAEPSETKFLSRRRKVFIPQKS